MTDSEAPADVSSAAPPATTSPSPDAAAPEPARRRRRWRPAPGSALQAFVGVALLVAGAGGVFVGDGIRTGGQTRVIQGNFPVNAGAVDQRDINAHNSPLLVSNPRDPSHIVIANRIDTPRFSCAVHVSFDGGSRWTQTPLPVPPGEEPKCYTPDAAFGSDGTLYVSFLTFQGEVNVANAVWVLSSRDGGRTLSDPVKALGRLALNHRLVADPERPGRLYLAWIQAVSNVSPAFPPAGAPVQMLRSDDGGRTWQGPAQVTKVSRAVGPTPLVTPRGELYVLYVDVGQDRLDYDGIHQAQGGEASAGPWRLMLAYSADRGATWRETVVEERLVPSERFLIVTPPVPNLAVDGQRVYASFAQGRDPDVWLWASNDGGRTFATKERVNDNPDGDGTTQNRPQLSVAPNGRLDVVYYDRRADSNDVMTEVSLQSSLDGGRTFTSRLELTDRAFNSRVGYGAERNMPELGSRLGLRSTDERALAVWCDTRAGNDASRKQDLVRALVAIGAPPGLIRQALGLGVMGLGVMVVLGGLLTIVAAFAYRSPMDLLLRRPRGGP